MGRTKYLTNRAKYLFKIAKLNLECTTKVGLAKVLEKGALIIPPEPREDLAEESRSLGRKVRKYRSLMSASLREEYLADPSIR